MAIFDRLDAMASRTVDRVNAIDFIMTPMTTPENGRPRRDETKDLIEGKGVFDYTEAEYGIELGVRKSYRESNDFRALQVGREPRLSIDRKYFPTIGQEPLQGWIVQFPTKPELPTFSVVSAQRDGQARLFVKLIHEGSQA